MSTKNFEAHLKKINQQFKAAKLGVSIRQRKNSLYIRATLPPKPTSSKTKNHQQDIPTGCKAQKAGLDTAEKMAKEVAGKIAGKTFDWVDYGVEPPKDNCDRTVAEWIAAFEQDYFERRKRTPTSEGTFNNNYLGFFKRLPQSAILSPEILRATIVQTEPDSSLRQSICLAFTCLGRFAHVDVTFIRELKGKSTRYKPAPRDLPEDDEIVRAIMAIPNPNWQWIFSMIAAYGLRPHEAFRIEKFDFPKIEVSENSKTGKRTVWPLHPQWIEVFDLQNIRYPNVNASPERSNRKLGRSVGEAARNYELPFPSYHLRHCWAVRAIKYNIPTSLAAKWMGHNIQIHTKIYQAWITAEAENSIYQQAIQDAEQRFKHDLNHGHQTVESLPTAEPADDASNDGETTNADNHTAAKSTVVEEGVGESDLTALETLNLSEHQEPEDVDNSLINGIEMTEEDVSEQGTEAVTEPSLMSDDLPTSDKDVKSTGVEEAYQLSLIETEPLQTI